jgi:hypothetical protein
LGEDKKRHTTGWYAGAAAFWLIAFWLVFVGLASIIPQIFYPEGVAHSEGGCAPALVTLENELLARVSESLRDVPLVATRDEIATWLEEWDLRHAGVRNQCTAALHPAWVELGRLRHGLAGMLERFDREQLPRIRTIERALGSAGENL